MPRQNNFQKYTAALLLIIFIVQISVAPLPTQAATESNVGPVGSPSNSSSSGSSGSTAALATVGALAAGALAYCIAASTEVGFNFFVQITGKAAPLCVITNPPGVHLLSADGLREWILKPAARVVIRALLQATTQQIVSWIQGNGGKNVGYVKNLEQALRREADLAGGEFLNNLSGINLCGNLRAYLNITLRTPPLQQRLGCSVTDIVRNVDNFYRDFQQGGWPAFIRISLETQNNPYGAYMIALDAKIEAESIKQEQKKLAYVTGKGAFEGFKVPVEKCSEFSSVAGTERNQAISNIQTRAEPLDKFVQSLGNLRFASPLLAALPPSNTGQPQPTLSPDVSESSPSDAEEKLTQEYYALEEARRRQEETIRQINETERRTAEEESLRNEEGLSGEGRARICRTEYETKTPGGLIAYGLEKATFGGLDFANTAKDFDEAISVIINALINKLITSTFAGSDSGSSGQGIFDPGFNNLPREDLTESVIGKRINDGLFTADAALALADVKLIADRKALFEARKKLDELIRTDPSGGSVEIQQTKQKISELQTVIPPTLEIKRKILFSQYDLLLLKRSLAAAPTPSEIQRVAQDLPTILLRLGSATAPLGALPTATISTGSNKRDLLESLRGTKDNLTNALTLVDDTGKEIERVLAGSIDPTKRQELTIARTALLTQRGILQGQLDPAINMERDVARTDNPDRIKNFTNDLVKQLFTINQTNEQTGDNLTKIDALIKLP